MRCYAYYLELLEQHQDCAETNTTLKVWYIQWALSTASWQLDVQSLWNLLWDNVEGKKMSGIIAITYLCQNLGWARVFFINGSQTLKQNYWSKINTSHGIWSQEHGMSGMKIGKMLGHALSILFSTWHLINLLLPQWISCFFWPQQCCPKFLVCVSLSMCSQHCSYHVRVITSVRWAVNCTN